MAVRATFTVTGIGKTSAGVGTVQLQAVAKGPFDAWAEGNPAGGFSLGSLNAATTAWFESKLGQDVVIVIDEPTAEDTFVADPANVQPVDTTAVTPAPLAPPQR